MLSCGAWEVPFPKGGSMTDDRVGNITDIKYDPGHICLHCSTILKTGWMGYRGGYRPCGRSCANHVIEYLLRRRSPPSQTV